ncbi:hypothetical protein IB267_18515 [Ensifer sp. ENS09]|uniref:hypothetical protein n=1 Tax=Ensifer sp. ENS09 TaxID=2769263 RepID=UPI0017861BF7|nr:hypothetical protein [Ensifer sp. ENS09]MBD9650338.1 hypothetical protein [Ensifer sp. ENS09]
MTDPAREPADNQPPELAGETDQPTEADDIYKPPYDTREAELEALRSDMNKLRTELAAIAAGTSRLIILEADAVKQMAETRIRPHLIPALVAAGIVGYVWSAFLRPR